MHIPIILYKQAVTDLLVNSAKKPKIEIKLFAYPYKVLQSTLPSLDNSRSCSSIYLQIPFWLFNEQSIRKIICGDESVSGRVGAVIWAAFARKSFR